MRLHVWSSDCFYYCWNGLREDEGVDESEPRGVSGARQAESQRVSQAGFLVGLEISGLRSKRTDSSLRGCSHENANDVSVVPDSTPALSIYGVPGGAGRALAGALTSPDPERLCLVIGEIAVQIQQYMMVNEDRPGVQSQSNEFRPQAAERLFLAVVNQAISDVLENRKEAKEAERWLLSKDFDTLDRLFACPAKPGPWNRTYKKESAKRLSLD